MFSGQFIKIKLCHACGLFHLCGLLLNLQRIKFVFKGSALRLSSSDISATHNLLREELAVSDISPVTAWAWALHHVTAIRSQLAQE